MKVTPPVFGGVPRVPPLDYSCWSHRIYVEEAFAGGLTDDELVLLLAHEVGHSTRRRALVLSKILAFASLAVMLMLWNAWVNFGPQVNTALLLASAVCLFLQLVRNPLREEFIADDFAVSVAGTAAPYRNLIQQMLARLGTKPNRALRKRLRRLG